MTSIYSAYGKNDFCGNTRRTENDKMKSTQASAQQVYGRVDMAQSIWAQSVWFRPQ